MDLRRSLSRCLVLALLCSVAYAGPMATSGQFEVSPTGAATYTIPLSVPPGTAGIEPKLSLVYNSQAGNGLLGVGWSLSGLSVITRCPRTMAQDGVRGGINFDANDRFCLDGQRLMAVSGTYGADGTEYRTERESFSKVVSYGSAGSGPAWFKVWTKAGQILEYGNTADSRIEAQGKASVRVWALNKLSDTKGNYFTVAYNEDNANGDYSPSRIDYTGSNAESVAPFASVRFVYEMRPSTDITPLYQASSLIKTTQRLTNVQSYTGENLVRDYRLTYELDAATQRSRISSLALCDDGGACLPADTLTWQNAGNGTFNGAVTSGNTFTDAQTPIVGDLNGDGRTDVAFLYQGNHSVMFSNGDGTFTTASYYSAGCAWGAYSSYFGLETGDFNGDGRTDYIFFGTNSQHCLQLSNGDGTFAYINNWNPNQWNLLPEYSRIVGDFNGDGRTDIAFLHQGNHWVMLSNGGGTFTGTTYHSAGCAWGAYSSYFGLQTGDFNGDGRTDYIFFGTNSQYCAQLSNGDGTFTYVNDWNPNQWNLLPEHTRIVGDFNGDGRTDIAFLHQGNHWVMLNSGNGRFTGVHFYSASCAWGAFSSYFGLQTGDFNGDGRTDYVFFGTNSQYCLQMSNGDGTFRYVNAWNPSQWNLSTDYFLFAGDINGDGRADVFFKGVRGSVDGSKQYVFLSAGSAPDLVSTVTPRVGAALNVAHAPLASSGAPYSKGTGSAYPQVDLQSSMYVVSQAKQSDGIGGMLTTNYRYGGAKAELGTGRGLLGFRWIEATNPQTGHTTRTEYLQDWPYVGLPTLVKKTTASGGSAGVLSQTAYTYACLNPQLGSACTIAAGNRYFPYVSQSVESGWDLPGAALPVVTTTNQFDAYGNATQVVVSTSDGFSKTTSNAYQNDTSNWFLGRLVRSEVNSVRP